MQFKKGDIVRCVNVDGLINNNDANIVSVGSFYVVADDSTTDFVEITLPNTKVSLLAFRFVHTYCNLFEDET